MARTCSSRPIFLRAFMVVICITRPALIPRSELACSNTVVSKPTRRSAIAAARPAKFPPIMSTLFLAFLFTLSLRHLRCLHSLPGHESSTGRESSPLVVGPCRIRSQCQNLQLCAAQLRYGAMFPQRHPCNVQVQDTAPSLDG